MSNRFESLREPLYKAIEGIKPINIDGATEEDKTVMIRELLEDYEANQELYDAVVSDLVQLAQNDNGNNVVNMLSEVTGVNGTAADPDKVFEFMDSKWFDRSNAAMLSSNVKAHSLGIAVAGMIAVFGGVAGVEYLKDKENNRKYARLYGEYAGGLDAGVGVGFDYTWWNEEPPVDTETILGGWYIDIPLLFLVPLPLAARVTYVTIGDSIKERRKEGNFHHRGTSLTIFLGELLGFGFPRGWQYVAGLPPTRTKVSAENCTYSGPPNCKPGQAQVLAKVPNKIDFSAQNTSTGYLYIPSGGSVKLTMPTSLFTTVSNSNVTLPSQDWTFVGWTANTATITYNGTDTYKWPADGYLPFVVDNLSTSADPDSAGIVTTTIPELYVDQGLKKLQGTISQTNLVVKQGAPYAVITSWEYTRVQGSPFHLVGNNPAKGSNVGVYPLRTQNKMEPLTKVTDGTNIWDLGYQFYLQYDKTSGTSTPQFRAIWSNENGVTQYTEAWITPDTTSPKESIAYHKTDSQDSITIYLQLQQN